MFCQYYSFFCRSSCDEHHPVVVNKITYHLKAMRIIPFLIEIVNIPLSSKRIILKLLHHLLSHRYALFFVFPVYHDKQERLLEQLYISYVMRYVLVVEYIATFSIIHQLPILLYLYLQLINPRVPQAVLTLSIFNFLPQLQETFPLGFIALFIPDRFLTHEFIGLFKLLRFLEYLFLFLKRGAFCF